MYYIIGLLLCGIIQNPNYTLTDIEYQNTYISNTIIDSVALKITEPYKRSLDADMNQILCYAKSNLNKGKPESLLGNWVADLCLDISENIFHDTIDMVLFNNGGLRYNLSKGKITKRDIYQLMPFENELVVLSLDIEDVKQMFDYLKDSGGQPISFSKWYKKDQIPFYVLTSDYLANGGDKMSFFQNKNQTILGVKMRDAIISYCEKTDTISSKLDSRNLYFMEQ